MGAFFEKVGYWSVMIGAWLAAIYSVISVTFGTAWGWVGEAYGYITEKIGSMVWPTGLVLPISGPLAQTLPIINAIIPLYEFWILFVAWIHIFAIASAIKWVMKFVPTVG